MYEAFLPAALADGTFLPVPEARVAGRGLEALQAAQDELKKGVSARKLVVVL